MSPKTRQSTTNDDTGAPRLGQSRCVPRIASTRSNGPSDLSSKPTSWHDQQDSNQSHEGRGTRASGEW